MDYSKVEGNVCYEDCKKCDYNFAEHKECFDCNYYKDCMVEREIDEFELANDRALNDYLDRLENEEYPL